MSIRAYKTKTLDKGVIQSKVTNNKLQSLNWALIKVEYFQFEGFSITEFLDSKGMIGEGGKMSGAINVYVKGWKDHKVEFLSKKFQKDSSEIIAMNKVQASILLSPAQQEKVRLLNIISKRLTLAESNLAGNTFLSPKDIKAFYEIIKTELGEPIKIIQNNNANVDINELLNQINDSTKPVDPKSADQEIFGRPDLINVEIDGVKLEQAEVEKVEA